MASRVENDLMKNGCFLSPDINVQLQNPWDIKNSQLYKNQKVEMIHNIFSILLSDLCIFLNLPKNGFHKIILNKLSNKLM